jgi:hypothetical protein
MLNFFAEIKFQRRKPTYYYYFSLSLSLTLSLSLSLSLSPTLTLSHTLTLTLTLSAADGGFVEIGGLGCAGVVTAGACVLCAAGTYQTGSGASCQHGLPTHLIGINQY